MRVLNRKPPRVREAVDVVLFAFYVFRASRLLVVLGLRLEIFLVTRDLYRRHVGLGIGFISVGCIAYIFVERIKWNYFYCASSASDIFEPYVIIALEIDRSLLCHTKRTGMTAEYIALVE